MSHPQHWNWPNINSDMHAEISAMFLFVYSDFMRSLISKMNFRSLEMKLYKAKVCFLSILMISGGWGTFTWHKCTWRLFSLLCLFCWNRTVLLYRCNPGTWISCLKCQKHACLQRTSGNVLVRCYSPSSDHRLMNYCCCDHTQKSLLNEFLFTACILWSAMAH